MQTARAALYIRVSTDDQLTFSPEAQKNALLVYARKNGMQVLEQFIFEEEGGQSGRTTAKRKKFMEMIGIAKTKPKPFDIILVHKFDRFARSRQDSIVYKSMLKRDCGIKVISVTETIHEDDKLSILIEALLEAMAEYYSINLAEEVKKGMTQKAKQGGFQTAPALGYQIQDGRLTIVAEEAEYIRYIYRQFVTYDKSPYQIAKELNRMGVTTKRHNPMDSRGVAYILRNPIYIGKVRWTPTGKAGRGGARADTIIAQGYHTPIITASDFHLAAQKLCRTAQTAPPKRRPLHECRHWLSGLVKCSHCGASLTVMSQTKYPSFQCSGYTHAKCDISHSISVTKLEKAFLDELCLALAPAEKAYFTIQSPPSGHIPDEITLYEKQLVKLGEKYERARASYLAGVDDLTQYQQTKKDLDSQKSRLSAVISSLQSVPLSAASGLNPPRYDGLVKLLMSDCDKQIKQKALRGIIQKVVYVKQDRRLDVYYYDM